jgi:orotate phosphoribosyltransferase
MMRMGVPYRVVHHNNRERSAKTQYHGNLPICIDAAMLDYQRDFIELTLQRDVLRFGEFTLKSGRQSPYFFNMGRIASGAALARLGRAYAAAVAHSALEVDMLFGPAYKGIPLAAATAIALADQHGRDLPWAYNRKEAKDHGEGGVLVGAPLTGRVLIVDDVLATGGTADAVGRLVTRQGAELVGYSFLLELGFLHGARKLGDRKVHALVRF